MKRWLWIILPLYYSSLWSGFRQPNGTTDHRERPGVYAGARLFVDQNFRDKPWIDKDSPIHGNRHIHFNSNASAERYPNPYRHDYAEPVTDVYTVSLQRYSCHLRGWIYYLRTDFGWRSQVLGGWH